MYPSTQVLRYYWSYDWESPPCELYYMYSKLRYRIVSYQTAIDKLIRPDIKHENIEN